MDSQSITKENINNEIQNILKLKEIIKEKEQEIMQNYKNYNYQLDNYQRLSEEIKLLVKSELKDLEETYLNK